jgi:uncharacterized integral membrane protein
MQFLKTLFWVMLAVILVLFAKANWGIVELRLWGGLVAEVRTPLLVLFGFLLGWFPTLIVYRARMWSLRRRFEPLERNAATSANAASPTATPVVVSNSADARVATDSKAWPTS